jgi:hypothetical protein
LATSFASVALQEISPVRTAPRDDGFGAALTSLLTVLAFVTQGYHPYAEDGGVYVQGIKRMLDPSIYPHDSAFVMEHLHFSLFARMMATLVQSTHLSVAGVVLMVHVASIWLTLFAAWQLAVRCYASRESRCGAVALLAVWLMLPVAGTALVVMDPYLTARSLTMPCTLFALVGVMDAVMSRETGERLRGLLLCCGALLLAGLLHPLMAGYALGSVVLLVCLLAPNRDLRLWGTAALCIGAIAMAAGVQLAAPVETPEYVRVVMTRPYWFLFDWHWYEQFGLIAPLIILQMVAVKRRNEPEVAKIALARMAVTAGVMASIVAMVFARPGLSSHALARLQPLRLFQLVYVLMILIIGATVGHRFLQRHMWRWIAVFALLSMVMAYMERLTFPNSSHIELPWKGPANPWEQAFFWVSRNTPKDALFALDANYISQAGEDAQGFRAIAERSMLPDYSKDGGIASITPELSAAWTQGQTAQTGLDTETDVERISTLKPLGVTWMLLRAADRTQLPCEYRNTAVKVCRLP